MRGSVTQNAFQNGFLPLKLTASDHARLAMAAIGEVPLTVTVDVAVRTVTMPGTAPIPFALEARQQERLLRGMDDIAETLDRQATIEGFRATHRGRAPWLYAPIRNDGPLR